MRILVTPTKRVPLCPPLVFLLSTVAQYSVPLYAAELPVNSSTSRGVAHLNLKAAKVADPGVSKNGNSGSANTQGSGVLKGMPVGFSAVGVAKASLSYKTGNTLRRSPQADSAALPGHPNSKSSGILTPPKEVPNSKTSKKWHFKSLVALGSGAGVTSDTNAVKSLNLAVKQEVEFDFKPNWIFGGDFRLDLLPGPKLASLVLFENQIGAGWRVPIKSNKWGLEIWADFHFDTAVGSRSDLGFQELTYISFAPKVDYQWNSRWHGSLKALYASLDNGFSLISSTNGKLDLKLEAVLDSRWVFGLDYDSIYLAGQSFNFRWNELMIQGGLRW